MAVAQGVLRGIVAVGGEEARAFLDRLVTCDMDRVSPARARLGALLSPQGKILVDFIAVESQGPDGTVFYLDCPVASAGDLTRRLNLYRLRSKVSVADLSASLAVLVGWDGTQPPPQGSVVTDPRVPGLGWRAIVPRLEADSRPSGNDAAEAAYETHRIGFGVPESGRDFVLGDAFPHEALMDQLGGVDFDKGCYIGQEVVSRMQHRGTARTRIVSLVYEDGLAAESGAEVIAGEKPAGRTASAAGQRGLAMIRLDRAADALAAGEPILAGGRAVRFAKPDWVRFPYPGETAAA